MAPLPAHAPAPLTGHLQLPGAHDPIASLGLALAGRADPTAQRRPGALALALPLPEGAVELHLQRDPAGLRWWAWGPGAAAVPTVLPPMVGATDWPPPQLPLPPALAARLAPHRGVVMTRLPVLWPVLAQTILGQLITTVEAWRAWAGLVRRCAQPAPGPAGLWMPPDPERVAATPADQLVALGVPDRVARTLRDAARQSRRIRRAAAAPADEAAALLQSIPGVGPWTAQMVLQTARGEADAVPLGDFHLPHTVAWALGGTPRGDDDGMLALLAPVRPHRGRLLRWMVRAGVHAPRWGPRSSLRPIDADRD